jgi:DNA-binding XRE family transcriptional regulator
MLAVVKTPRIEIRAPEIPGVLLRFLRETFGPVSVKKEAASDGEEAVDVFGSEWYKSVSEQSTPGESVRICRELFNVTQAELARRMGLPVQNISAIEKNRRPITRQMAEKLSSAFGGGVPPGAFYFYSAV